MKRVALLLKNNSLECIALDHTQSTSTIRALQHTVCPAPMANPIKLQRIIHQFLNDNNCTTAPVAIALDMPTTVRHIITESQEVSPEGYTWHSQKLNEGGPYFLHAGIASPILAQCQLLAINTPFYCAGITTYQLAQMIAAHQLTDAYPPVTDNVAHYIDRIRATIDNGSLMICDKRQLEPLDQLCLRGLQKIFQG